MPIDGLESGVLWRDNRGSLSSCQIKHVIQTFIENLLYTMYQSSSVLDSNIQKCVRYRLSSRITENHEGNAKDK